MTHLRIDYIEFASGDLAKSKTFFGKAFGWAFQDYGPDYAAMTNAGLDGGLQSDPAEASAAIFSSHLPFKSRRPIVASSGATTTANFPSKCMSQIRVVLDFSLARKVGSVPGPD